MAFFDLLEGLGEVLEFLSDLNSLRWRWVAWFAVGAALVAAVAWGRPGPAGWVEVGVGAAYVVLTLVWYGVRRWR